MTFTCSYCGVLTLHEKLRDVPGSTDNLSVMLPDGNRTTVSALRIHFIFRCVHCGGNTYFLYRQDFSVPPGSIKRADCPKAEFLYQYPVHIPTVHHSVPATVADATVEAEKCLSVGAPNACGVMIRRAMQALCEDKGAVAGKLVNQLKDLKAKQIITPGLHEWADSLRVLGNGGAHPDLPEISDGDADDGMKLLREIVKFVYILPDDLAQKRKSTP
jgi:hypothetical protein